MARLTQVVISCLVVLAWGCQDDVLEPGLSIEPAGLAYNSPPDRESAGGETVSLELLMQNTGTAPLLGWEVSTSCGCIALDAGDSKERLEPGEKLAVRVQAHVPAVGARTGWIEIQPRDARVSPVRVPVKLQGRRVVPPFVQYVPPVLQISTSVSGAQVEDNIQIATIEESGSTNWLVDIVPAERGQCTARLDRVEEMADTETTVQRVYTFTLSMRAPTEKDRPTTFPLDLIAQSPILTEGKRCLVKVQLSPPVTVLPELVRFPLNVTESQKRTVILIGEGITAAEITLPKDLPDWLTVSRSSETSGDDRVLLDVAVNACQSRPVDGRLVISVNVRMEDQDYQASFEVCFQGS